jgi:hypothetical protein
MRTTAVRLISSRCAFSMARVRSIASANAFSIVAFDSM